MESTNTPALNSTTSNPYQKRVNKPIKVGETFKTPYGEVAVIDYCSAKHVHILFMNTLTTKICTANNLRLGKVKDLNAASSFGAGYVGEGPHRSKLDGVQTPASIKWTAMLNRVYGPDHPSYAGTSVDTDFLNFQVFSEWFEAQPNKLQDLSLDRDLLPFLRGDTSSKQYSANNCSLIPQALNLKLSRLEVRLKQLDKARKVHPDHVKLPIGMSFDRSHHNFRIQINGLQVGSRTKLKAALDLYEKLNIQAFIAEVESHKEALSSEVLAEFCAYKQRIEALFQPRIKAPEAEMTTV